MGHEGDVPRGDQVGEGSAELDIEEVRNRIRLQQEARAEAEADRMERQYSFIRPFDLAAASYVRQVQDDDRLYLGVVAVDQLTRGHSRGDLTFVTGRPFSGKTQLILNAINYNSSARGIIFTPDETAEMVLAKLVGIRYGVNAEQLEERIKEHDSETMKLVHHVAAVDFSRLIVIDAGLTLEQMGRAVEEAEDHWGAAIDYTVYDYLELLPGDTGFNGVTAKAQAMKRWTKEANVPMLCLHQAKKGDSSRGEQVGMSDMRFGGDDAATAILGVYRKRENKKLPEMDRLGHKNTVSVNVAKNKRPPMLTGEVDLYLHPETGTIRALTRTDLVRDGAPTRSATELLRSSRDGDD